MAPSAPTGTMTRFAFTCPGTRLRFDVVTAPLGFSGTTLTNVLLLPGRSLMPVTLTTTPVTSLLLGTMSVMFGFFASAPRIGSTTVSPWPSGAALAQNAGSRESKMRPGLTGMRRAPAADDVLVEYQPKTSTRTSAVPTLPEILTVTLPFAPSVRTLRFGTVCPGPKLSTLDVPGADPLG